MFIKVKRHNMPALLLNVSQIVDISPMDDDKTVYIESVNGDGYMADMSLDEMQRDSKNLDIAMTLLQKANTQRAMPISRPTRISMCWAMEHCSSTP